MAELIITHRQRDYLLKMPYQVIINGRLAGVMRVSRNVRSTASAGGTNGSNGKSII